MPTRGQEQALGSALTVAASALFIFFWASGFVSAKYGLPYAEPFTFLSMRFVLAVAILLPLCLLWRARWPRTPAELGHVVVAGVLVQSVYLIGVFQGIRLGLSTGVMALIVGLQPLITGAMAASALGERVAPRQWLGLGLGFGGLGLVVAEKVDFQSAAGWGAGFAVLGLLGITIGTLYQKRFCTGADIRSSVTIHNFVSALVIAPLAFGFETMRVDWTGEFVAALLWLTVGLSVIAIGLYYFLLRHGAAARVTSLIYLSPPTTALMGWAMFQETMPPVAIAGMAVAVAGVALANR